MSLVLFFTPPPLPTYLEASSFTTRPTYLSSLLELKPSSSNLQSSRERRIFADFGTARSEFRGCRAPSARFSRPLGVVKSKIFGHRPRRRIFEFGRLVRQAAYELTGLSVRPRSGPTYLPQACCSIRRTPLPTYADGQSGDNRPPSWQGARTQQPFAAAAQKART